MLGWVTGKDRNDFLSMNRKFVERCPPRAMNLLKNTSRLVPCTFVLRRESYTFCICSLKNLLVMRCFRTRQMTCIFTQRCPGRLYYLDCSWFFLVTEACNIYQFGMRQAANVIPRHLQLTASPHRRCSFMSVCADLLPTPTKWMSKNIGIRVGRRHGILVDQGYCTSP